MKPATVVITGSRNWTDREAIAHELKGRIRKGDTVIHGDARGADRIAASVAEEMGATIIPVPAEWEAHGKPAGAIRNRQILDMNPSLVVAFPLPGSIGTWDCVNEALRRGIPVVIHSHTR